MQSVDADRSDEKLPNQEILIPNKTLRSFLGVSQDKGSLSSLTLRQLRHKASALGVPLYSRKSKAALVKEIGLYQEKQDQEQHEMSIESGIPDLENQTKESDQDGKEVEVEDKSNTDFRKKASGALWSVWIAVLGIISKLIFWN